MKYLSGRGLGFLVPRMTYFAVKYRIYRFRLMSDSECSRYMLDSNLLPGTEKRTKTTFRKI